jgi:hypothetical protein
MSKELILEKAALSDDDLLNVVGGLEDATIVSCKDKEKKHRKIDAKVSASSNGQEVPINLLNKSLKC